MDPSANRSTVSPAAPENLPVQKKTDRLGLIVIGIYLLLGLTVSVDLFLYAKLDKTKPLPFPVLPISIPVTSVLRQVPIFSSLVKPTPSAKPLAKPSPTPTAIPVGGSVSTPTSAPSQTSSPGPSASTPTPSPTTQCLGDTFVCNPAVGGCCSGLSCALVSGLTVYSCQATVASPTPSAVPTSTPTAVPTSTPTPTPSVAPSPTPSSGNLACDPSGQCNNYGDPVASGCPVTFTDVGACMAACSDPANRCQM